jgi:putative nucleotidyltransferase with HDIG domain
MQNKKQLLEKLRDVLNVNCEHKCIPKKFFDVFDNAEIGVYVTSIDGDILYANSFFCELFGYNDVNHMIDYDFNSSKVYVDSNVRLTAIEELKKNKYYSLESVFINFKTGKEFEAKDSMLLHNDLIYGIIVDLSKEKKYIDALKRAIIVLEDTEMRLTKTNHYSKDVIVSTVETLSKMGEIKDPYTYGHQMRVKHLSLEIGKLFKLNDEDMECLEIASILHDIGKFYTPTEILVRPGKLTEHEMNFIKLHSEVGAKIVEKIPFKYTIPVHEIIHQHHERLDGSGYPLGLKGDEIHFLSRIISVADVVEAVTNHRPYRAGLGIDKAMSIINEERGIKLDDDIVDACIQVLTSGFKFNPNI